VVILAAKLPHRVLPTSDQSPPRKRLLPGSGTLNTTLITRQSGAMSENGVAPLFDSTFVLFMF
jgi:hypothetical protein